MFMTDDNQCPLYGCTKAGRLPLTKRAGGSDDKIVHACSAEHKKMLLELDQFLDIS
jgi:hypothetical protein